MGVDLEEVLREERDRRAGQTFLASPNSVLWMGSKGPDVADLQRCLQHVGLFSGVIDGIYGPKTIDALKQFQARSGLCADGVAGPRTLEALSLASRGESRRPGSSPRVEVVFQGAANRWVIYLDGVALAEIAVEHQKTWFEVRADSEGSHIGLSVHHRGGVTLAPIATPGGSFRFREVDLREGQPAREGPRPPPTSGASAKGHVGLSLAPPSALPWPDKSAGELAVSLALPPGFLSEFEERVRADRSLISGVVLDPENSGVVIGYRVPATTGVMRLVDREGTEVFLHEIGLEQPLFDPLDLIPSPGAAAKGTGLAGKLGLKILGVNASKVASQVPLAAIARMRGVSRALASRAARRGMAEAPGLVRRITKAGLDHSFDRHAAQWFGREVQRETHLRLWRELIERATLSSKVLPWSVGAAPTVAHISRIEGKYFVVQFFEETGELATAFVPNSFQLREMLRLLK